METVICAAIWYDDGIHRAHLPRNIISGLVVGGWRHCNCMTVIAGTLYPNWQTDAEENKRRVEVLIRIKEGFLTSKGRYVDRVEAGILALKAEQIKKLNYSSSELFSEDLY